MRRLLTILTVLNLSLSLNAQMDEFVEYNNLYFMNLSVLSDNSYAEIEGQPFTHKELLPGTIEFLSGERVDNIPMRYNWYEQRMEFKPEDRLLIMPESIDIKQIELNGDIYIPFFTVKTIRGYLISLYQGEYNLFLQEKVTFTEAKPAQSGYEQAQPAKFQWRSPQFVLVSPTGDVIKLEQNKKRLARQFPPCEAMLSDLIKQERLNPKEKDDVILIVKALEKCEE